MATQIVEIPTPVQAPPPAVFLTELAFGMKMTQALQGHRFGLGLSSSDRQALISFLKTL